VNLTSEARKRGAKAPTNRSRTAPAKPAAKRGRSLARLLPGGTSALLGEAGLRTSFMAVAACGAALALAALALFGRKAALSAGVGAGVAEVNLWTLARIVSGLLRERRAGLWASVAFVKMFALFAVVGLLMRYADVAPLAMIVGFGALPMGIAIGALAP